MPDTAPAGLETGVPAPTVVVLIGDMALSRAGGDVIATHNLGSCLGVTLHDPVAGVGGILHAVFPEAHLAPGEELDNPWRFVDVALPLFLSAAHRMGARRENARVTLFGCASVSESLRDFSIGARNLQTARAWLSMRGVSHVARHVGGRVGRTITLRIGTGEVWMKCPGEPATRLQQGGRGNVATGLALGLEP
ncbi:MAG: chemotaxis protein CheD [Nitrospirae bacterium]|nr:chemotaxis protein CheD [Nitrospirota bacterium]